MTVYPYSLEELGYTAIDLGKQGENKVREIDFDLRDWVAEYPEASAALYISQPNTTVYLAATKMEDGILKWPILNTYTATPGFGNAEIVLSGKNGERLKSATASIFVSESMSEDEQGEAPEYMKPYADQVAENAAKAEKALEEIKNIGTQPGKMPTGGESGQILAKKSNADYDTHWIDPPKGGGDGTVTSVTVNGTRHEPDSNGNVDLGTIQGGTGGAQYINELLPDPNEESVGEENVVLPVNADNSAKLGGKAPEYYTNPRNLLDNSDFRNPVNQRRVKAGDSFSGNKYTIDKWDVGGISATFVDFTNAGIVLSGRLRQFLSVDDSAKYEGKTLTFAAKIDGTILCCTASVSFQGSYKDLSVYDDPELAAVVINAEVDNKIGCRFIIKKTSALVEWAALYEGAYTAETLPPYVPKGYANELLACEVAEKGNIFGMDLLWENASPGSEFASQTVPLDLRSYNSVMIRFKVTSSLQIHTSIVANIPDDGTLSYISTADNNNGQITNRVFYVSKTGINFQTGYFYQTYANYAERNQAMYPIKIYGIKGVGA